MFSQLDSDRGSLCEAEAEYSIRHLSPHFTVETSSTRPSLTTPSNAMVKPSFASFKRFLNSPWGPTIVQTFCMYGTYQYIERYVFKSLYSSCSFLSFLFSNQFRLYHHLNRFKQIEQSLVASRTIQLATEKKQEGRIHNEEIWVGEADAGQEIMCQGKGTASNTAP